MGKKIKDEEVVKNKTDVSQLDPEDKEAIAEEGEATETEEDADENEFAARVTDDNEVMSGLNMSIGEDKEESDEKEKDESEEKPKEEPLPAAAEKAKIKIGSRQFDSQEEADEYFTELERKEAERQGFISGIKATAKVEAVVEETPIEELIFDDPKKAIERIENKIRAELKAEREKTVAEDNRKAASTRIWNDFYSSNPDLKGFEDQVDMVYMNLQTEKPNMDIKVGLATTAQRARDHIELLRRKLAPKEVVNSGRAKTIQSTGAEVPRTEPESKVLDFVSELKSLRKRG